MSFTDFAIADLKVNDIVLLSKAIGVVLYIGPAHWIEDKTKIYVGLELTTKIPNGHDGTYDNQTYFSCKSEQGIILPINSVIRVIKPIELLHKVSSLKTQVTHLKTKLESIQNTTDNQQFEEEKKTSDINKNESNNTAKNSDNDNKSNAEKDDNKSQNPNSENLQKEPHVKLETLSDSETDNSLGGSNIVQAKDDSDDDSVDSTGITPGGDMKQNEEEYNENRKEFEDVLKLTKRIGTLFNHNEKEESMTKNTDKVGKSQRRLERRRNLYLAKQMRTKLKSSNDIYNSLKVNEKCKDIIIGYTDSNKEDCEILFTLFNPDHELCHISFQSITYYRTTKKIIWNKKSRIDTLFNSGDTKLKLQKNPTITDVSFANYNNLPSFVKKLIYALHKQKTIDELTKDKDSINTPKHAYGARYSHFLSIRLNNPYIIKLGTQLQQDIVNHYKKQNISISSSLVQPFKFHISMNIMALPTEKDVEKFGNIFKLVQKWLKVFVFDKSDTQKILIGDDGIFLKVMEKNGFLKKFKTIYKNIENESIKYCKGYPLYLEGANHFNQNVVFLDFKNKCVMEANNVKWKAKRKVNRNDLVLKLIETFYELIVCLCKAYKIGVGDSIFIPHCTVMKLSKLRRIEMKKFMRYNKINEIRLLKNDSGLGDNKKKRGDNKVYDWHALAMSLSNDNIDKKIKLMKDCHGNVELYEDVMNIDFCAMMGSHLTEDGFYKVIQSLCIVSR